MYGELLGKGGNVGSGAYGVTIKYRYMLDWMQQEGRSIETRLANSVQNPPQPNLVAGFVMFSCLAFPPYIAETGN